ncbi:MAG TPA: hypothetical protein PLI07_13280, partial [Candidatus Hydrogenedentes bacterium]|nr:hypothetical protein [Candidatus Hydrogenedentota bacterium]
MAHSFADGRGFHDIDRKFREVPEALRPYFLARWIVGVSNKPSRDMVFEITKTPEMETAPMFLPTLPLAANGGRASGMAPDMFVPLVGVLWFACLVLAATRAGGLWGLAAVFALVFGTSWPSWFLRGFHPEAVGGALISTVVVTSAARRRTPWWLHVTFGFMLGLSISFHPTMSVLALPVALALMIKDGKWSSTAALAVFGALGVLPLLVITKHVCAPYGDFLNPGHLASMLRAVKQIRFLGYALLCAAALGLAAMALAHSPRLRERLAAPAAMRAYAVVCGVVSVLAIIIPSIAGGFIGKGWSAASGELRLFALTAVFAWEAVFIARRPLIERA